VAPCWARSCGCCQGRDLFKHPQGAALDPAGLSATMRRVQ
jgi:hypothetical protein